MKKPSASMRPCVIKSRIVNKLAMKAVVKTRSSMVKPAMKGAVAQKTAMKVAMKKPSASMRKAVAKKRVSKIAQGKRAKVAVFFGSKEKTVGGITKDGLVKNKYGKIVSKKGSAVRKKFYKGSRFEAWINAVKAARKELGIKGLVTVNGASPEGKSLYARAKVIYGA